jgi:hypothetical protein
MAAANAAKNFAQATLAVKPNLTFDHSPTLLLETTPVG